MSSPLDIVANNKTSVHAYSPNLKYHKNPYRISSLLLVIIFSNPRVMIET